MAIEVDPNLLDAPVMGMREFLRGGYQGITKATLITRHGGIVGIYTPVPHPPPEPKQVYHERIFLSTRRR